MSKLINIIGGIGFALLLLGAAGMDNKSVAAPVVLMVVGVIMIFVFLRMNKEFYTEK